MKLDLKFAILTATLMAFAGPLCAHHSFAAEYDASKPITLKGVVTKFEWVNPHSRFFLDVTDATGTVAHWEFEAGNPTQLQRSGWKRNTLKPGDVIVVFGHRAKDGTNLAAASKITTADGVQLFNGAAPSDEAK